eukprot:411988-Pelagomonas_calceolata.AAC.1
MLCAACKPGAKAKKSGMRNGMGDMGRVTREGKVRRTGRKARKDDAVNGRGDKSAQEASQELRPGEGDTLTKGV